MTDLTEALDRGRAARSATTTSPPGCRRLTVPPPADDPPRVFVGDPAPAAVRRQMAAAELSLAPPPVQAALAACGGGGRPWPLYLHGPAGGGKTSAALALLRACGGLYLSAGWWDRCRVEDKVGAADILGCLDRARLVVVDEIGLRAVATDWQLESLKLLLDGRAGLPLVVTGNVPPRAADGRPGVAEVYDGRIADRLLVAGSVCRVDVPSRREWRA